LSSFFSRIADVMRREYGAVAGGVHTLIKEVLLFNGGITV
jgi:hypothetical protein